MKTSWASSLDLDVGQVPVLPQAAALCYRLSRGRPEVLLITSRRAQRWIIPKGWLIYGLSASETAAQEAWEEAGVIGTCVPVKLGQFPMAKTCAKRGPVLCAVDVYPLHVDHVQNQFPETGQRKRKWCTLQKAASKVNSPDLAAILRRFAPRIH
ncbi:NUDIX hydrolase [Ruegeria sp. R13_0]|uniref:NUDIX hydrolase n=1 Tax=Ruegeria sp. R13_0 TaxID=2821099 RepID=UPI001ADCD04D|nr:NUDIX hydrolase [Ruegeria sp. R13_0]MBO9435556.1 NUDIX hydrolase [Ruegeria sp. R13_0]